MLQLYLIKPKLILQQW